MLRSSPVVLLRHRHGSVYERRMLRAARYLWSEAVSGFGAQARNHWRCVPTARPQAGA